MGSAVVETRWGAIGLLERGGTVVFLTLADDPTGAGEVLGRERAEAPGTRQAIELAREVAGRIDGGLGFDGIPVEVSGTPFQEAVWRELTGIPRSEVVTYGDLARRIDRPGAARAVGAACGANPVALLIPCHRVIAADGGPGGYRWGTARKVAILAGEGVTVPEEVPPSARS
jgi:AraC family transcriptional regulator of adaptative response/methylated-DNA-[protein]-cysteine methyltransferase